MQKRYFLIFLILLITISCANSTDGNTKEKLTSTINNLFSSLKPEENSSETDSTEVDSTQLVLADEMDSDAGLEWLKGIFKCDNSSGFCLPDEEKVTTKRFWEFVVASNEINANPYGWEDEELQDAERKYQEEWEEVYPLYQEEIWPFGRGNGGVPDLENVEVSSLGNQQYQVDIQYHESYSTKNKVTLIPVKDGFLIDYIQTETDLEKDGNEGETDLKFTQKWTWSYKDDGIEENEFGHKGEITAYYSPETNYWLMTRDTYGISGEQNLWILGKPDGSYISEGVSVHPEEPNSFYLMQSERELKEEMPAYYQESDETKTFVVSDSDGDEISGKKYDFTGTSMAEGIHRYMIKMGEMDFSPLYYLGSSFSGEPRLPYSFPEDIPSDYVILEEVVTYARVPGEAVLKLESVSDTLIEVTHPEQDQLIKF